ncbi:hypothetical protein AAFC00_007055 [Neodothiora populina]|uniref:mRNA export factor mex67 n=1 Tax=Neodothiora populina TaxID=2781224 RepID=A0ABR3PC13_9PEZI
MVAQQKKSAGSGSSRGAISKRKSAARTDRDGDVSMGALSASRGGGISKGGKSRGTTRAGAAAEKGGARSAAPRINGERAQREIAKHITSGGALRKRPASADDVPEEIRVTGWKNSKAANNDDGGLHSLIVWIEKKATTKHRSSNKQVKVKKSRVEGDDLIISVPKSDVPAVLRTNGWVFAGTNIKVERASAQDLTAPAPGSTTQSTIAMLQGVLARRYNAETKLLDLSALGADPDLKASAIFDSRSTTSKFFPAMMKVLDNQFESTHAKNEAIVSVSLANNELPNITAVTTLAQTLPHIKNLDLSNNAFANLAAIEAWRRKFRTLDLLVLSPNPLEQNEPDYAEKVVNWYPKLRILNNIQVRSDEDLAKPLHNTDLPFPIRAPVFQDEGQIAENFLRNFFAGYDSDRAAVAQHFYDASSDFSLAVNTQALKDPAHPATVQPQEWDLYIKRSRNLKKIQQLPARQARLYRGSQAIAEAWAMLPVTRHPDLATEARKWNIECQLMPGIPDPTGASPGGVDGFIITVHGEFNEIDVPTNNVTKTRSFDRVFTLGPGGPSGVRVVNDMLTIRGYGGFQAFEPDEPSIQQPVADVAAPAVGMPPGLTPELAEQMVLELQKQTGMIIGYATDCLDQVQWDFDRALQTFNSVRANLPPEAFVVVAT